MKTERLIAIIMLLMESDKISASKLANMFEVTKRTIYRCIARKTDKSGNKKFLTSL